MVKLPGFVKIYMPSLGEENLKIPSRFIQSIQGNWLENVALRDRYNNLWQVRVEMAGGYCYFKDGWTKFADDNMIEGGDLIVYEYFSQGILDFKVHDRSACLAKGVGGHKSKKPEEQNIKIEPDDDVVGHTDDNDYNPTTEVENRQDDHPQAEQVMGDDDHCVPTTEEENQRFDFFEAEEVTDDDIDDDNCFRATEDENDRDDHPERAKVMDAQEVDQKGTQEKDKKRTREDGPSEDNPRGGQVRDGSTSSTKKRSKRDYDWYGEELFQSGLVQQPKNPYFVTKKRKSRAGELYVPGDVIRVYNLKLPDAILLIDPKERQFRATRKTWSDGRTFYVGGWKSLCGMNLVGDEHSCICEFVQKGCDLCIRVSIVPPKGQQP